MTQPKSQPFRFHSIAGVEDLRDVKPHLKREQGWVPGYCKKTLRKTKKRKWRKK